ncbi:hypothetical protein COO91_10982 (plasmid) [Nostoc flagelliforme CCNUN1]|uniref:Uncharacterized protein n=1 Tax=Nostoc flagelliforme CCNUN1 TaxID=2038116 RepID=A0A2K8TAQ2_9NOSO|nr:hypothetical protein COO91_10982 [Nostoc flagelliforme CCNUN1]
MLCNVAGACNIDACNMGVTLLQCCNHLNQLMLEKIPFLAN